MSAASQASREAIQPKDGGHERNGSETRVQLSRALQAELEQALAEADREEGTPADELLERLRKYG